MSLQSLDWQAHIQARTIVDSSKDNYDLVGIILPWTSLDLRRIRIPMHAVNIADELVSELRKLDKSLVVTVKKAGLYQYAGPLSVLELSLDDPERERSGNKSIMKLPSTSPPPLTASSIEEMESDE
ncbi:MAG: hypothetical protein M1827_002773 [Pycnora praestabilis]|nr:MAG: hypothetical protein M1827_002773 [Pycnora praestabilis]